MPGCDSADGDATVLAELEERLGLKLGDKVQIERRFTVSFGDTAIRGKSYRKDMQVGDPAWVVSCNRLKTKSLAPVLLCRAIMDGVEVEARHTVTEKHVKKWDGVGDGETGAGSAAAKKTVKPPTGYDYIGESAPGTKVKIEKHWVKMQTFNDDECKLTGVKHQCCVILRMLAESMPTYTTNDFTLVEKELDGTLTHHVYAARDFAAHTVTFCPDANELDSRNYSLTSSIVLPGGPTLLKGLKHLCLKGRLRTWPLINRAFSLFFAVRRLNPDSENEAVPTPTLSVVQVAPSLTFGCGAVLKMKAFEKVMSLAKGNSVSIPMLYNEKKIKKGTELTAAYDEGIAKLDGADKKRKAADAAADKDAKKAKES